MVTRSKTKKVKSKPRKQTKAKSGKERRPDGLVIGSDGANKLTLVEAPAFTHGVCHNGP